MALIPKPLTTGSRIAVISPAGPIHEQDLQAGMDRLRTQGFEPEPLPHALDRTSYLAGSDRDRAADLMSAFTDPRYDAIACSRGGYGTMRILEYLDYKAISASPKPLIGFSDISALQWTLWKRCGLLTFSGPQVARGWGGNLHPFSQRCWLDMLTGRQWNTPLPLPEGEVLVAIQHGEAEGRLVGGNLALMAGLAGTPDAPSFADSIVLLEEIDEPLYRIDRMMTQLRLAGVFNGVRGVLLGRFVQHVQGEAHDQVEQVADLIREAVSGDVPVLAGVPYGHVGPMWTVPLGAWCRMDADGKTVVVEPREK